MMQYVEFAHLIHSAMQNNCPTVEWLSWKFVSKDVKKAVMDQLFVSVTNVKNN
ncbi:hypothetical protein D8674_039685 [Pyrus ussuriensis x Pyrus communis]|uniref:Uncharacterized protein n=1 Tax=Pyrus ussuriensis x Pyrus communis TaxID=2448454 RepID=A0A5N5G9X2_9ROSA|nr:hypothetical protein D8674_039685 [Pyrus ussuriensis x Pyrus communis]